MQGSNGIINSIMFGVLAAMFGAAGVGLLCLARLVARDREVSPGRRREWLPLNEKWFGVGCGLGFGFVCVAISGICLFLMFIGL